MGRNNNKKYMALVVFLVVIYVSIFTVLNVARYYSLFSFEWEDEATENQIVWNTAHGMPFYQTISDGYFYGHVNPFYLFIALGYLIVPHIFTWYFLSTLGIALGGMILYKLACMEFDDERKSFFVALVYFLYFPLHYVTLGPIDTITFFMPSFLLSFYFFKKDKFLCFIITSIIAMSCMENVPLFYIMFSLYALICRKQWKWVTIPLLLSISWFIIGTWLILPFTADVEFDLNTGLDSFYSLDRHTFARLLDSFFKSPSETLTYMFSTEHVSLLNRLISPLCFVPFISITVFMGIPGFLQLMLVDGPLGNENAYYIANVIPFIFLGYIYGLKRLNTMLASFKITAVTRERIAYFIIMISVVSCLFGGFQESILGKAHNDAIYDARFHKAGNIFDPLFYQMDDGDKIAWSMIRMIPGDASVSASGDLLIPLSHRKKLLEFGKREAGDHDYFDVDYILINKQNMYHGAGHYEEITTQDLTKIDSLVREGVFEIISAEGSFVLLKRIKLTIK